MRQKWVVGNWKMHGSTAQTSELLESIKKSLPLDSAVNCIVCPPLVYLSEAASVLQGSVIGLGAQNLCAHDAEQGAYTGEVSAAMLQDLGVSVVLVGHSERRQFYADDLQAVAQKFLNAQDKGLQPILCVGETLEQRNSEQTLAVIAEQIEYLIAEHGIEVFADALIAYEPIWAIGTGLTATPEQAQTVHAFIRHLLAKYNAKVAATVPLLYGGSVNASNAQALFAMADIDGALVGGASLKAEEFSAICQFAE